MQSSTTAPIGTLPKKKHTPLLAGPEVAAELTPQRLLDSSLIRKSVKFMVENRHYRSMYKLSPFRNLKEPF